MRLLKWENTEHGREALLGTEEDGVRFTVSHYPTCYRRGPYRLLIEVLPGEHHHDWGCFDDADQPERYYHIADNLRSEAEAIAAVLWSDRLKRGSVPTMPTTKPV